MPGVDAIPYAGWRATLGTGEKTLAMVTRLLCSGYLMPLGFNFSLSVFAPKGSDPDDNIYECAREPVDIRPLALKNTDNKTVCSIVNEALKDVTAKFLNHIQRGFTKGRQLLNNVTDLDTAARCYSMSEPKENIPALCFFDFATAFPSVIHEWLFKVFQRLRAPDGLYNLLNAVYTINITFVCVGGRLVILFVIESGVLQGCPLSGVIFAITADPAMEAFDQEINRTNKGCIRACADDIGAALHSIWALCDMAPLFEVLRRIAGFTLKPKKCIIIPVG